jgi:8-oxo-dGTP pyrophosphatase MutT (NUDIX family)
MTTTDELQQALVRGMGAWRAQQSGAAVMVPLVPGKESGWDVVLEVRSSALANQPGDVCCPGGHMEPGETARQAAIRETCEELLVSPQQVRPLASLGQLIGPGGRPLEAFVCELFGYTGTFSTGEVSEILTVPLNFVVTERPTTYPIGYSPTFPEDFPWERIRGGRSYRWRQRVEQEPFYDTDPCVWGVTARVLERLGEVLRLGTK